MRGAGPRVRSAERVNAPVVPQTGEKAKTPLRHASLPRRPPPVSSTSLFASLTAFPSGRRFAGHNGQNPRYSGISMCNPPANARSCYHRFMTLFARDATRRSFLATVCAALPAFAQEKKGESFPAASHHYSDPTTELDVIRLTDPAYSSTLPAYYSRTIARNSGFLLFCCDRGGSPQAFRIDLKTAQQRQLTDAPRSRRQFAHVDARQPVLLLFRRPARSIFPTFRRCMSASCTRSPRAGNGARD